MDVVNALAAILQLSEQLLQLGDKCHRVLRTIHNPSQEMWDLHSTFSAFGNSLFRLHIAASETINQDCSVFRCLKTQKSITGVYELSKGQVRPLQNAIRKLRTLQGNGRSRTNLMKAKLLWTLSDRHDVRELLVGIEPVKAVVSHLTSFLNIRTCLEEAETLQGKLKAIPPELISKLSILQREDKRLTRECQSVLQRYKSLFERSQQSDTGKLYTLDRTERLVFRVQSLTQEQVSLTKTFVAKLKQYSSSTLSSHTTSSTTRSEDESCSGLMLPLGHTELDGDGRDIKLQRSASVSSPPKNRYSIVSSAKTESTIRPSSSRRVAVNEVTRSADAINQTYEPCISQESLHSLTGLQDPDHIRNKKRKSTMEAQPSIDRPSTVMAQPDHSFRGIGSNAAFSNRSFSIRSRNTNEQGSSQTPPEKARTRSSVDPDLSHNQTQIPEVSRWSMTSATDYASSSHNSDSTWEEW